MRLDRRRASRLVCKKEWIPYKVISTHLIIYLFCLLYILVLPVCRCTPAFLPPNHGASSKQIRLLVTQIGNKSGSLINYNESPGMTVL